ncbi:MAG: gamma-glutamyltransferase [Bacteroidota bacterium]
MKGKTKGWITAGHPDTAAAAERMLLEGGNAFDAAIAALWATFIAEACMCSAGGGAFANIYHQGNSFILDGFCQTPISNQLEQDPDFFPILVDFGTATEEFHVGLASMAVPGTVALAFEMADRFASLPMKVLMEPAIELAINGSVIDDFQHYDHEVLVDILSLAEPLKSLFFKANRQLLEVGDRLYLPKTADVLEHLALEGPALFYQGELSAKVAQDSKERGGFLRRADFEHYQIVERPSLSFPFGEMMIHTNPLPSIGGPLMFHAAKGFDRPFLPAEHLAEVYQMLKRIDDAPKRVAELAQLLPSSDSFNRRGSTTHFNVLDEYGQAVAITGSNGEGSGYCIPGTDIQMNNMLGESALLPDGFHNWTPNTRLSSMMSPCLVTKADQVQYVLGTGGASRIPRAILQVLHYLIASQLPVDAAVHAPRAHWEHGTLELEPGFEGLDHEALKPLNRRDWDQSSMFFGGVHVIGKSGNGFVSVGDQRRSGVALVVE